MAILRKPDPTGIDKAIDKWQVAIYNGLVVNGTWTQYESYHRGYKNRQEGVLTPQYFTTGSDYITVTMNDNFCVTSFFVVKPQRSFDSGYTVATVSMIFQADVARLYPNSPHRFDEELINDVIGIMDRDLSPMFRRGDIVTGIDDVYQDFDTESIDKIKHDMQPYNVARFDMEIRYVHNRCDTYAVSGIICTVGVTVSTTPPTVSGGSDGTATANVTDDQGLLTYLWTTIDGSIPAGQEELSTATGLTSGTYEVLVSDAIKDECSDSSSGIVEEGSGLPQQGNIKTWLVGDNASTINGGSPAFNDPVDTWADFLGSGNDATQTTPNSRPLWKGTYVQSDGDDWLTFGEAISKLPARTVFIVMKPDSLSGTAYGDYPVSGIAFGSSLTLRVAAAATSVYGSGTAFRSTSIAGALSTSDLIYNDRFTSGNVDPHPIMQVNGIDFAESSTGTATTIGGTKNDVVLFRLGELPAFYMTGRIYEFIVYSIELNNADNLTVTNFLKAKYGIA